QLSSHHARSLPGREPLFTARWSYRTYPTTNMFRALRSPVAQKIHPMGLRGWRDATRAPTTPYGLVATGVKSSWLKGTRSRSALVAAMLMNNPGIIQITEIAKSNQDSRRAVCLLMLDAPSKLCPRVLGPTV